MKNYFHKSLIILLIFVLTSCTEEPRQYVAADVSSLSLMKNTFYEPINDQFRFVVFAHAYGSPNDVDEYPANTLVNHLEDLFGFQPKFFVSLGDMVQYPSVAQFDLLDEKILNRIDVPVFNAVGNHDVKDRQLYQERYGSTYYSFTYGNALFIVLDTEIDACNILGGQKEMLEEGIASALKNDSVEKIFILMHKVLFVDSEIIAQNPDYLARPNDFEIFGGNNFADIIDSILLPAAKEKPIYMFAGDVGAFGGNMSPYYNKFTNANLYAYAAGIGDTEKDVVFIVTNTGKSTEVQPYRISDKEILNPKEYSHQYWEQYGSDSLNGLENIKQQTVQCTIDVCRFAKSTFHIQCRYFMLALAGIAAGFLGGVILLIRSGIRKRKAVK